MTAKPTERITRMEAAFDRARAALSAGQTTSADFPLLAAYMSSGDWLRDYEADEAGLLPRDLKRGVLSQDALYDLLAGWEALRRKPVIHLFGASGSGTTTLGRALADALHCVHLDTDDFYWLPTDPAFTQKRPIPERLAMMHAAIDAGESGAVISGSLTGWGDPLIPRFTLAVRVVTDAALRLTRLRQREYARFGDRIRPGGDMHAEHEAFIAWASRYDTGDVTMRSRACHDAWQAALPCPVVTVDGAAPLQESVARVLSALDR